MNVNSLFPSSYLRVGDLNGKAKVITIAGIKIEEIGPDKEKKPVLQCQETDLGFVLNKVNAKKINKLVISATMSPGIKVDLEPYQAN